MLNSNHYSYKLQQYIFYEGNPKRKLIKALDVQVIVNATVHCTFVLDFLPHICFIVAMAAIENGVPVENYFYCERQFTC